MAQYHHVQPLGRNRRAVPEKGSSVYIEGRLQTRKWQDKTTGQDRYTTEIIADQMQMLSGRSGGNSAPADRGFDNAGYNQQHQQQQVTPVRRTTAAAAAPKNFDDYFDEANARF